MNKTISAAERPLSMIFSKQYDFVIPPYQRPYSWTTDEAGELFDDLYGFHQQIPPQNATENRVSHPSYFLGSTVLIKKEETAPEAIVVDGQQRLTTLTILLSAIASQMPQESKERQPVENYIREPGNRVERIAPKPRLALRNRDKDFFEKSIQRFDFTWLAKQVAENDAQKNIQANAELFVRLLTNKFPTTQENQTPLLDFVSTIILHCYLVAVSTSDEVSAFRIFTVLNTRGLDLLPTDIIKAEVIGSIPEQYRNEYSQRWEQLEEMTGRSGFHNLFEHMRMIRVKDKARQSLLDEFKEHVLKNMSIDMEEFIDGGLSSYADAYHIAKKEAYVSPDNKKAAESSVNRSLYWLNRIDNSDWLPSAILFLSQKKSDSMYAAWFFRKLERLAAFQHICAKNVNQRIARYAKVILDMNNEHSMNSPIKAIELTESEKTEMKNTLNGEIYGAFDIGGLRPVRRNYAILRLDSIVADEGVTYDRSYLTIEHVLPQSVSSGSDWEKIWPDKRVRDEWVGRIANLVPLNRSRNSAASNYAFCRKKSEYFSSGAAPYALTSQVVHENAWTPQVVESRQKKLLAHFVKEWELE